MEHAQDVQLLYRGMRQTHVPPAAPATAAKSIESHYADGLAKGASIASHAVNQATRNRQDTYVTWLAHWFVEVGCPRDMDTCMPEDIIVYATECFLQRHAGTVVPGGVIVAPVSLSSMFSHLSSEMERRGRNGLWAPGRLEGNPMKSPIVEEFLAGYHKQAFSIGYAQKGAVPLSWDDFSALLRGLAAEIASAKEAHHRALLARDAAAFCLAWHTKLRGQDLGKLQVK